MANKHGKHCCGILAVKQTFGFRVDVALTFIMLGEGKSPQ